MWRLGYNRRMGFSFDTAYTALKHAHISFVVLSYLMFVIRGALAVRGSYQPARWSNRLIHGVDVLLLVCGVSLAVLLQINPLTHPWLMTKLVLLVLYVVLAASLVRRGRTQMHRLLGYVLAQLIFLYIIWVAVSKNPLPFI